MSRYAVQGCMWLSDAGVADHHVEWSYIVETSTDLVNLWYATLILAGFTPNGIFGTSHHQTPRIQLPISLGYSRSIWFPRLGSNLSDLCYTKIEQLPLQ